MKTNRSTKSYVALLSCVLALGTLITACANEPKQGEANLKKEKRGAITSSIYDRGNLPPEEGTIDNNRWTRWINEKGPVDVKFISIPRWESKQKYNTLFASGGAPDIMFEYDTAYLNQLYTQKSLMPLDDLIEKHSTEYKKLITQYPVLKQLGQKADGKNYLFGRLQGLKTSDLLFIRMDWLKKLNLQVPATTDDLFKVAKAFREQDPDGNGMQDTYGINLSFTADGIINSMFQNTGYFVQDGNMVRAWEQAKEATTFKKKLFEAGIVDKDYLTDKNGEKAKQDWITGKLGIFATSSGVDQPMQFQTYQALKKNFPDAQIAPIELPKGPYGQFNPGYKFPVQMTAAINVSAKDPISVMKYVDFLVTQPTMQAFKNGIEGEHFKMDLSGCPEPTDKEKIKREMPQTNDLAMLSSFALMGKCEIYEVKMNLDVPQEKEYFNIIKQSEKAYLNPERAFAREFDGAILPVLPNEMQVNLKNTETMEEMWKKSIVSGDKYTPEQALKEAQSLWEKTGGKQIDEFYAKWYSENKDKIISSKDLYKLKFE
ncbi:extracellular solute-binding protein [Paenibacillus sp. FSL H7-0331]|uniref:extracellular solute-binding protein n=1 Tax=Paenibacillus sp. FSL H7-0331 TaxID=1920421 RepID=UPI00096D3A5A|nr:extracellular solute-binding protein [Paenibacillus sp. FSL H7-0331]OMF06957.1 hypothetical protein BK127_30455 [Paenibacillus sp. FSL H7-0331]